MAYSYTEVTATGADQLITVPPYILKSHIFVALDGGNTTDFTWVTDQTVKVRAPAGVKIRVYRSTSPGARLVDYIDGMSLTEAVMDADSKQAFYLAQEQLDNATDSLVNYGTLKDVLASTSDNAALIAVANDLNGQNLYNLTDLGLITQGVTAPNGAATKGYIQTIYENLSVLQNVVANLSNIQTAADAANSAALSASSASTSATNAASSATSASTSATNAGNSASSASTSATAAATSATNAANSASSAATSATNAGNSASSASTSAASATTQAGNASSSASAAATSATNASSSATLAQAWATQTASEVVAGQGFGAKKYANDASASAAAASSSASSASSSATSASTSASTATTQATNASNSASNASTSASNAAGSATSAANSATAAATSATNAANSATAAANSATSAASSASSASSTYLTFDKRYLGAKTSAPSTDNQGAALVTGAVYWNSTVSNTYYWDGATWVAGASGGGGGGGLQPANNLSDLTNVATARSNLGLAIGTNVQAYSAELAAIAGISATAGLLKKTAAGSWTLDTTNYITAAGAPVQSVAGRTGNVSLSTADISGLGTFALKNSLSAAEVTGLGSLATQNTVAVGSVTGLGALATKNTVGSADIANAIDFGTLP